MDHLLSPESLRKTGYFDVDGVQHWRTAFKMLRAGSNQRTMIEMGLVGVVATQLWHHTYIDGSLCELPGWSAPAVGVGANGVHDLAARELRKTTG